MSSFVTGDLQNNVEKLRRTLRSIHYAGIFDVPGIISGEPETYLPLIDYVTMGFSRNIAKYIVQKGHDFYTRTDVKFIKGIFKFVRDEFNYNPCLQPSQFLSKGYAERKIILICKLVQHLKKKHNEIVKKQREKRRKKRTYKPMSRVEVIQGGSEPIRVKPKVTIKKNESVKPVDDEYDEDPCTHDTDPTYLTIPVSKGERPEGVHEGSIPRPYHMKEELMNAMVLMKKDLLEAMKMQTDLIRNEMKVRMTMLEGRVNFLENALKEKRIEDSRNDTQRIVNESRVGPTGTSTMIRKDFTMRLPTSSTTQVLSGTQEEEDEIGDVGDVDTRSFIDKYRRKNEETLGIISDS